MSDEAEARRQRAQARKDKIAARGQDRLDRITGVAKGEGGAEARFGTGGSAPPSRPLSPSTGGAGERASPSLPALAAPSFNPLDDPPDVDISTISAHSQNPGFEGFPSMFPGMTGNGDVNGMPDMLSALLSGGGGNGNGNNGGFPDLAQMFGQQPGGAAAAGDNPFSQQNLARKPKTWTDRLLPLVHLLSMLMLAFWAVFILEPRVRQGYSAFSSFGNTGSSGSSGIAAWIPDWKSVGNVDWYGWAALGRGKQGGMEVPGGLSEKMEQVWQASGRGVAGVQIIYMFLTLELMLQGAAILIFKTRPPIPSLLNTFLPHLPPQYAMYVNTGIKYWALLGQVLDDLAVLVLSVVGWILVAEWKTMGNLREGKLKFE